ncbi:hypothetical protein [Geodermatophilus sp. SYSU D00684]
MTVTTVTVRTTVAGVAALVISRYGDARPPQDGAMRTTQVEALISRTADGQLCPEALPAATSGAHTGRPYEAFTGSESGAVQQCQGGSGHTSGTAPGRSTRSPR